ncbi:DNA repair protein XRCC1 [Melitaea cinxia]|uniref:DNA repair protein XRCC1 n=1 Tax=Melitaea cinxia TaxID=113334 RepID=UPI001E2703B0|nr:DNA repair protein XRCC1 [Melitaea cinxia]
MPRVKIDYVVSFSSEDPEHPANNLLEWEISKKKWLCSKGESHCSVVLQLTKAVKIESINIGAYHAASVEVLVGLSEKPNDPFEVLVPTCMLLSPSESRREAVERVRSFSGAALAAARERRWDRVRLVCAQPYNKHCKYGLSFVHVYSTEAAAPRAFVPALALESLPSDDEEFQPGELFAQHSQRASTGAQIRQASMEAIKNNSDKSTKLQKTPINRPSGGDRRPKDDERRANRQKDNLMYTDDDDRPHARIDHVVERHKQQRDKEQKQNVKTNQSNDNEKQNLNTSTKKDKATVNTSTNSHSKESKTAKRRTEVNNQSTFQTSASENENSQSSQKKRKRSNETLSEPFQSQFPADGVLAGVCFTLSGYENPRRAELRAAALALGAAYRPDYSSDCTHIVCAFPNTPKLRAARAAGSRAAAVSGEWITECARSGVCLPWRRFAVEPHQREAPPASGTPRPAPPPASEEDTDDEIEKVIQQQEKKKRLESPARSTDTDTRDTQSGPGSPAAPADTHAHTPDTHAHTPDTHAHDSRDAHDTHAHATDTHAQDSRDAHDTHAHDENTNSSLESDVTFVRDERMRGLVTLDDSDSTDCDERAPATEEIDESKVLPNFFEGLTFSIAEDLSEEERALLARYVRAYGGLVLEEADALGEGEVDYRVCGAAAGAGGARAGAGGAATGAGGARVSPAWVWRCHRLRARAPSA